MIAGHSIGHCSAEGKLLKPHSKKQDEAVEGTINEGNVPKQTFLLDWQIPRPTRDSPYLPLPEAP